MACQPQVCRMKKCGAGGLCLWLLKLDSYIPIVIEWSTERMANDSLRITCLNYRDA
ncbi:hypothetical protein Plhal304r1_c013g0049411 [Plasmopara halstedii]